METCNKHGLYKDKNCPGCVKDAAPKLLDACEAALRWFDEAIANNIIVQTPEPAFSIRSTLQAAIAAAKVKTDQEQSKEKKQ